jgi:hypothetical protein
METIFSPPTGRLRPSAGKFCVLVSSSDRARDVFEIVFRNSETIWRNCDWPRYVGFTNPHPDMYGFKVIAAKQPSNWQGELGDQLDSLPDDIEYVLRLDEDALFFSPVDGTKLNEIADLMVQENISYVSLLPLPRNIFGRIAEFVRRQFDKSPLRRIAFSEPYYSSIAVVVWKRSYLRALLRKSGTIWELEHAITDEPHYAVWTHAVDQDQIVTRGKWNYSATRQLARQGLSLAGSKRERQSLADRLRKCRESISFQLFGFLSFRIRRRLNKIARN